MKHKLTISLDDDIYAGLYEKIGRGRISQFIEQLVRPYVVKSDLEAAYREMRNDTRREADASLWSESFIGDIDA